MSNQHLPTASMVRCPSCDGTGLIPTHKHAEIDRLRAELVRLEWIEKFSKDAAADNDRLRAENAELRTFIKNFAYSEELSGRSMRLFAKSAYELLAKTAKDGEPTAAASDRGSQTRE